MANLRGFDVSTAGSQQNSNVFRSALEKGEFVYTAELVLGRDHSAVAAEDFVKQAALCPDGIKFISLTDLPGGHPALPADAFVAYVREHNLTPIAHLTGKDGNRSLLEARLHALARLGAENILALTGDAQKEGFAGQSKPVYDLDSVLILWLLRTLRDGLEYNLGTKPARTTPFDFFAGAVVNPFKVREPDLRMQFYKLQLKVAAGAQYIITQLGYNLRKLYEVKQYMVREGLGHVPVLANVYVPTAKIAQMMQAGEVAGCVITDELIRRLEGEKKPQRLERAALMVAAAKDLGFAGAHIGGFGLTHADFMTIIERAAAIGKDWRGRMDELVFPFPNEFYLFPARGDGLSDGASEYQVTRVKAPSVVGPASLRDGAPSLHKGRLVRSTFFWSTIAGRRPVSTEQFLAPWLVVRATGTCDLVPQGNARLRQLWRLPAGPSQLCRVLDALVLQGIAQRPVRRLPGGRKL